MKKKYDMVCNREHFTVAANDIIKGKQSMTLQTARLIRLLITQIVKEDKDLKTYSCTITQLADFLNISKDNLYRDIKDICDSAMKSVVYIGSSDTKKKWRMFHWVSTAEYDGNGNITLRLSDEIKPYVLELEKWFTQYQLKNILEFQSYYAIRLYEIIKCEDGATGCNLSNFEFKLSDLRKYFACENKYERISNFKSKVIDVAVREINDKSDIWLNPTYKKNGRSISTVIFEMHYQPSHKKIQQKELER